MFQTYGIRSLFKNDCFTIHNKLDGVAQVNMGCTRPGGSITQPDNEHGKGCEVADISNNNPENAASAVSLHDGDDVGVMVSDGRMGMTCTVALADGSALELTLASDVPFGHKLALRDLSEAEPVTKYGVPIGRATAAIPAGTHVHIHNLAGFKTQLSGANP